MLDHSLKISSSSLSSTVLGSLAIPAAFALAVMSADADANADTEAIGGIEVDEDPVVTIVKDPLGLLVRIVELAIAATPVEVSVTAVLERAGVAELLSDPPAPPV